MKILHRTTLTGKEIRDRSPAWLEFINNVDRLRFAPLIRISKPKPARVICSTKAATNE